MKKIVVDHTAESDPVRTFTRQFVYDGEEVLLEYDARASLLAHYTQSTLGTDDVMAVEITARGAQQGLAQSAGIYSYLKDSLGSIIDVTDELGNRIQHYIYSAYGTPLAIKNGSGIDVTASPPLRTSYSFTGRELDSESGLLYYRARYYDPSIGRFLQKDPDPGQMDYPASVVNSYIYVMNNPANWTDPSGELVWFLAIPLIMAVAGAVTGGVWAAMQGQNIWQGIGMGAFGGLISGVGAVAGIAIAGAIAGVG